MACSCDQRASAACSRCAAKACAYACASSTTATMPKNLWVTPFVVLMLELVAGLTQRRRQFLAIAAQRIDLGGDHAGRWQVAQVGLPQQNRIVAARRYRGRRRRS